MMMKKIIKNSVKTTFKQKISLILLSVIFTLIILEIGLRATGFTILSLQRSNNIVTGVVIRDFPDDTYRILALGESTTANLRNGQSSWPKELEIMLNKRSKDVKFKVFNEGITGIETYDILSNLEYKLDTYKPDMVITMMGLNNRNLIIYNKTSKVATLIVKSTFFFEDFRVYKLIKLIVESQKAKVNLINTYYVDGYLNLAEKYTDSHRFNKVEEIFKKTLELNPNDDATYSKLGRLYRLEFNLGKAENMFKKALEINPNNYKAYYGLGSVYYSQRILKEAEDMFEKALEVGSNNSWAYLKLGDVYYTQGKVEEAEDMFKKALEINPDDDEIYREVLSFYSQRRIPKKQIIKNFEKLGFPVLTNMEDPEIIKYHYRKLYHILNKQGIKYAAMQYPTLDIDNIKNIFEGDEDIIFVSNEENFKKALENGLYEEYFIDDFGSMNVGIAPSIFSGNFGHATLKGNMLIAENVADVILKDLGINS